MRCCVAFCKNAADHVFTSDGKSLSNDKGISFHGFPRDKHLSAAWLRALGRLDALLPETALVCSQHFLLEDFHEAGSGLRQLHAGAVPSTVQVCVSCLVTGTKMFLMSKYKLNEVYEKLTGYPLFTHENLKQTVCILCAKSLINCNRFRNKSLSARSLMMDLVKKHEILTKRHLLMINYTKHQLNNNFVRMIYGPYHCNLHILYDDRQTKESNDTVYGVEDSVTVKNVRSDGLELEDPEEIVKDDCYASNVCEENSVSDESIMLASKLVDDELYKAFQRTQAVSSSAVTKQNSRTHDRIKVCMTCLITDTKMFLMSKYKLNEVYEKLTGYPVFNRGNLKQTVCVQCAQSLINFNSFRDKSLRARSLMMDLVSKHEIITIRHIKMINRTKHQLKYNFVRTTYEPNHCDLHIHHDDTQIGTFKDTVYRDEETVMVQKERDVGPDSIAEDCCASNVCEENPVSDESIMLVSKLVDDELCKALQRTQAASGSAVSKQPSRKQDRIKIKNKASSIACVLCFEEFSSECDHLEHMARHLQNIDSDAKCDTSQVCEPGTSVSCSRGSSHITQNKLASNKLNDDPQLSVGSAHTSVTPCFNSPVYTVLMQNELSVDAQNRTENINTTSKHGNDYQAATQSVASSSCRSEDRNTTARISPDKPFKCHLCNFRYRYVTQFACHMRTHTGEKPFSCTLCEYKCAQKSSLTVHMEKHTSERPLSCHLCDYTCKRKSHLVSHVRIHTGEKPYSCKFCDYKFAQIRQLYSHVRSHTGMRPHACQLCNSKFTQKWHLQRHMMTHTGEKPFPCKICNLKFTRKCHVKRHMATHTGNKPFSCDLCNRTFAQKKSLAIHIKIHSGKNRFFCDLCYRNFAKKSGLVKHMKSHS